MNDVTKDLWKFPCEFPIKIVGQANEAFEIFVLTTIRKHFPDIGENAIQTKNSKDGNYLAITATVKAQSKEQLDAAYIELSGNELVLMVL